MIEHTLMLRVQSLNREKHGANIIYVAARHNLEPEARAKDHIDSRKTSQNVVLRGAFRAADVAAEAVSMMELAKVKPLRINASLGIEIIFSLPPSSGIAEKDYFTDAVEWAEGFFEIPILSAVIHNDEAAPHCHIILLPLFNGRMIGNALLGTPVKLKAMHADFHTKVAERYGLKLPKPAKRHSVPARTKVTAKVVNAMKKALRGIDEPTFWDAMRDTITESPAALMAYFGIEYEIPTQPKKTFASIMTKNCPEQKHKRAIVVKSKNAIVVTPATSAAKVKPLSCVVVADSPSLIQPAEPSQSSYQNECVRESEEDQLAGYWDGELGEYVRPPTKTKPRSAKIEQVRKELAARAIQAMRR